MSAKHPTTARPQHQPTCPDCGAEGIIYDDPVSGREFVCTECVRWEPTDEYETVVRAVRLGVIRRAV